MKVLIVYDSIFGNTEKVAFALRDAVPAPHEASALQVSQFSPTMLAGVDLLVVGSPTRAFRPTPATTSLLKSLASDALASGIRTAAFDTRVSLADVNSKFLNFMVALFGYAANPIDKALVKHGGTAVCQPAWFIVNDKEGPLKEGELDHAANWMGELLTSAT
ncbi:MAG: flavodoxin family protein [Sphaerochaetaceae bacterium]